MCVSLTATAFINHNNSMVSEYGIVSKLPYLQSIHLIFSERVEFEMCIYNC